MYGDLGISLLDIPAMKAPVELYLRNYYSDIDSESEKALGDNTLMILGTDDASCPATLARSIVIYGLKKVIKDIYEALENVRTIKMVKCTLLPWRCAAEQVIKGDV